MARKTININGILGEVLYARTADDITWAATELLGRIIGGDIAVIFNSEIIDKYTIQEFETFVYPMPYVQKHDVGKQTFKVTTVSGENVEMMMTIAKMKKEQYRSFLQKYPFKEEEIDEKLNFFHMAQQQLQIEKLDIALAIRTRPFPGERSQKESRQ